MYVCVCACACTFAVLLLVAMVLLVHAARAAHGTVAQIHVASAVDCRRRSDYRLSGNQRLQQQRMVVMVVLVVLVGVAMGLLQVMLAAVRALLLLLLEQLEEILLLLQMLPGITLRADIALIRMIMLLLPLLLLLFDPAEQCGQHVAHAAGSAKPIIATDWTAVRLHIVQHCCR